PGVFTGRNGIADRYWQVVHRSHCNHDRRRIAVAVHIADPVAERVFAVEVWIRGVGEVAEAVERHRAMRRCCGYCGGVTSVATGRVVAAYVDGDNQVFTGRNGIAGRYW